MGNREQGPENGVLAEDTDGGTDGKRYQLSALGRQQSAERWRL